MIFNQIKTALLLGALTALLLFIGALLGGQQGLMIGLLFSLLMNVGAFFFSHKIVLAMYRAQELPKSKAPKLHEMIEEICLKAELPKPKVYLIPTETPNAFATGPTKNKAVVAVTQGIMKLLTHDELKGVLSHEIGHIKNHDMLITTIAATIASVISYIAMAARYAAVFGGNDRDNRGGVGGIVSLLALSILAPLAAALIQLAISRSREYVADERGARFMGEGEALASALLKIEKAVKVNPIQFGNPATASLFIMNPFRASTLVALFSTHPPTAERVKRLHGLKL